MLHSIRRALAALLMAALFITSPGTWAQTRTQSARVLSSTLLPPPRGGYSVVVEHAGQTYTTWMPQPPGSTVDLQISVQPLAAGSAELPAEPALVRVDTPPPPPAAPPLRSLMEPLTVTLAAISLSLGLVLGGGWLRPGHGPGR